MSVKKVVSIPVESALYVDAFHYQKNEPGLFKKQSYSPAKDSEFPKQCKWDWDISNAGSISNLISALKYVFPIEIVENTIKVINWAVSVYGTGKAVHRTYDTPGKIKKIEKEQEEISKELPQLMLERAKLPLEGLAPELAELISRVRDEEEKNLLAYAAVREKDHMLLDIKFNTSQMAAAKYAMQFADRTAKPKFWKWALALRKKDVKWLKDVKVIEPYKQTISGALSAVRAGREMLEYQWASRLEDAVIREKLPADVAEVLIMRLQEIRHLAEMGAASYIGKVISKPVGLAMPVGKLAFLLPASAGILVQTNIKKQQVEYKPQLKVPDIKQLGDLDGVIRRLRALTRDIQITEQHVNHPAHPAPFDAIHGLLELTQSKRDYEAESFEANRANYLALNAQLKSPDTELTSEQQRALKSVTAEAMRRMVGHYKELQKADRDVAEIRGSQTDFPEGDPRGMEYALTPHERFFGMDFQKLPNDLDPYNPEIALKFIRFLQRKDLEGRVMINHLNQAPKGLLTTYPGAKDSFRLDYQALSDNLRLPLDHPDKQATIQWLREIYQDLGPWLKADLLRMKFVQRQLLDIVYERIIADTKV